MIKLILGLVLVAQVGHAGPLPRRSSHNNQMANREISCAMQVAGRCFKRSVFEADTFKILIAQASTTNNSGFFEGITQTNYVVPADTQLRILAMRVDAQGQSLNLYYSDDAITTNTATVGTNPVYLLNGTAATWSKAAVGTGGPVDFGVNIIIPTGKYPNINGVGGVVWQVTIFAVEESTL